MRSASVVLTLTAFRTVSSTNVLWHDGEVYVSDTFNHVLRKLHVNESATPRVLVTTFVGDGDPGFRDGLQARFHRPRGIAAHSASHMLYVADQENGAIRAVDLKHKEVIHSTCAAGSCKCLR